MHIRNVPVLVLTFLLCSFGTVSAQPAEDYRLSSSVLGFRLPEDLQIQSAADIGDARLAVWATTFPTGAGESEGGLVMNLNGMESRLTKSGARPYGAVDVVAFADRFLVLWNDRRSGGEGIYGSIVGTDGRVIRDDWQVSPGGRFADSLLVAAVSAERLLFWTDLRNGAPQVRALRLDAAGNPLGSEFVVGSGPLGHTETFRLPDNDIVAVAGDTAVLLAPDGSFRNRTFPASRARLPHYVGDDLSFVVQDSGHIAYYASPWNPEPEWRADLTPQAGDTVLPFVGRDSAGIFVLAYRYRKQPGTRYYMDILLHRVEPGGPVGPPELVLADSGYYHTQGFYGGYSIDTIIHRYGCLNTYNVRFNLEGTFQAQSGNGKPPFTSGSMVEFFVNSRGRAQLTKSINPDEPGYLPGPCGFQKRLRMERTKWDTVSAIRVVWSTERIWSNYDTTIASVRYRESQTRPVLLDQSGVRLAWYLPNRNAVATAPLPDFTRGIEAEPFAEGIGALPVVTGWNTFYVPRSSYSSVETREQGTWVYKVSSSVSHLRPGTDGWISSDPVAMSYTSPWNIGPVRQVGFGYDPQQGEHYVAVYAPADKNERKPYISLSRLDENGVEFEREKIFWNGAVPEYVMAGKDYLLMTIGNNNGIRATLQGQLIDTVIFPYRGRQRPHIVQPLRGDRFARVFLPDSLPNDVLVDVVTRSGGEIGFLHLKGLPDRSQITLLQNPRDERIMLLWGSAAGVRAAYLTKDLKEIIDPDAGLLLTDFRISGTADSVAFPTALFRNDTLFLAWEDYRDGEESEMYGTWWAVPESLIGPGEDIIRDTIITPPEVPIPDPDINPTAGIRIISVSPNPATGAAAVTVQSSERRAGRIEVYDAGGRRVIDRWIVLSPGTSNFRLDVGELFSGSYTVRVTSGTGANQARLIVWGR